MPPSEQTPPPAWWARRSEGQRAALAFALVAALAMLVQVQRGIDAYPYDSALYWQMALDPSALPSWLFIRGYFYPFVMGSVVKALGWVGLSPVMGFRVFSALACAAVLTWVLPATYRLLYGGSAGPGRRVVLALVMAVMYPGLLLFPLSEWPALGLIWMSVYGLLRARQAPPASRRQLAGWLVLSGFAAAAAYNTRTVYLFSLPLIAIALWLLFAGRRIHLAWFAAGAILVSLPQVVINHRVHGKLSANPTVAFGEQSLFASQLWLGVRVQKYESALMPGGASSFQYADPAGQQLFARLQREGPVTSVRDYVVAVARHPLEFAGIYGRHLLNGIDVRDGRMYLEKPSINRIGASLLCFTALLLAVFAIATRERQGMEPGSRATPPAGHRHWLLTGALILPGLLAVPGQMETRFMVPAIAYLYTAALAHAWWPGMRARVKAHWPLDLAMALVAYAVFFGVIQSSIAHMQPPR